MTLYDLCLSYKETASTVSPLRSMYRDVCDVIRQLENYYPNRKVKT